MNDEFEVVVKMNGADRTEAIKNLLQVLELGEPNTNWLNQIQLHYKGNRLYFNNWMLDIKRRALFNATETAYVGLTAGEFNMMEVFCRNPQKVLSREEIYMRMHKNTFFCTDRVIDVQIGRVRRKLNDNYGELIHTVRGSGYMLKADVTERM